MGKTQPTAWREASSKKEWQTFLARLPDWPLNFTQSYNWGWGFKRLGQDVHWRLLGPPMKPRACYIAVIKRGQLYSFISVVGGPALDWSDGDVLVSFREDLVALGRRYGCHFALVCPHILDDPEMRRLLATSGFRKSPAGISVEFAGVLDLSLSDEQLAANMSKNLRYKIRQARRDPEIKLRVSKTRRDAERFADIHLEHARRYGYVAFNRRNLLSQFEVYAEDDQARMYIAERQGEVLSIIIIFFYGWEASFHYGVSTPLGLQYPSSPLLHLEAIAEAKKRGLRYYNLWGIARKDQTKHRYYGVSRFKRSFGVIEHLYLPPQDIVLKRWAYPLIWLRVSLRRIWRHL